MTTGEILKYKTDLCDQYVRLVAGEVKAIEVPGVQAILQSLVKEAFSDGFDSGVLFSEGKSVTFTHLKNDTDTGKTQTDPSPGS